jgi:hypothetical protein
MKILAEIISDAGHEPYAYSGRFMYGDTCLAVDGDNQTELVADIMAAAQHHEDADLDSVADILKKARTDSMGMGIVMYWPSIKFEGE